VIKGLSDNMIEVLLQCFGRNNRIRVWNKHTVNALEDRGLIYYYPRSERISITTAGRYTARALKVLGFKKGIIEGR